ncbi:hypothetical protein [Flavobacterium sp. 245]|uniref:hypothetical protein n=1 Tax=Flavobacterium sp. 245 TaxID=2512115 RepID=UPI0010600E89|nr:hypothetical protein [Flavobacterium sp. 245]TDO94897.1 hypothetical protein EV145_11621 [Flavobacterium sp. 245]
MKKKILLAVVFLSVLNSCSSDSGDKPSNEPEEIKGEVKIDYKIDKPNNDFVVSSDNSVYIIGQEENADYNIHLQKVDLSGKVTKLKTLIFSKFFNSVLTITSSDEILLTSPFDVADTDKIYRFENNFVDLNSYYTMKIASSPTASKSRMPAICNNNDKTYFVFDYNSKSIKRIVPELGTDVFVAGSGKEEIKDGKGLSAGFIGVSRIISLNNVLYVIDNKYDPATANYLNSTIRKVEYINNEWNVTTLISSTTNVYSDMAFDSKNDLYVLVYNKGLFKLDLQNNSLSAVKEGETKIGDSKKHETLDLQYARVLKIKNNDMYLLDRYSALIKISNFQTKFEAASK